MFDFFGKTIFSTKASKKASAEVLEGVPQYQVKTSDFKEEYVVERVSTAIEAKLPEHHKSGDLMFPDNDDPVKVVFIGRELVVNKSHLYDMDIRSYISRALAAYPDTTVSAVGGNTMNLIMGYINRPRHNRTEALSSNEVQRKISEVSETMAAHGTTDLHIFVNDHTASLMYRAGGTFREMTKWTAEDAMKFIKGAANNSSQAQSSFSLTSSMYSVITPENIPLPEGISGIRCQFNHSGTNDGRYCAVFRFLRDGDDELQDFEALGFNARQIRDLEAMLFYTDGLIYAVGPTGHGKSKSLQVCVKFILDAHNNEINIHSIESPIEYKMKGVFQRNVQESDKPEDTSKEIKERIKEALRSDIDKMVVGETRDGVVAKQVFTVSLTGHQVLSTLHVNNVLMAPERLLDMGVEEHHCFNHELVRGVIGQRLVQVLCPDCKVPHQEVPFENDVTQKMQILHEMGIDVFYKNSDPHNECETCEKKGYIGRTLIAETLLTNHEIMEALRQHDTRSARQAWFNSGGQSMMEHGMEKVIEGIIDPQEVKRHVGFIDVEVTRLKGLGLIPDNVTRLQ